MATLNENFLKLQSNYLFADIAKRVKAFKAQNPDAKVISLGIGDVTQPICDASLAAMHKAVDDLAQKQSFRGYGPEQGYDFLIEAIIKNDYEPRGVQLKTTEVFVSDGAKSDTGNIGDIFGTDNKIAVTDPVYHVYIDTNAMAGRTGINVGGLWTNIVYLPCTEENNFLPKLPHVPVDIVYLCYPNNPSGTVMKKTELKKWVDYAIANQVIIMYDAAYEAFIRDEEVAHSIYEIEGAKKVAIEFRSYSKTAGFTGIRCGYTVVPEELTVIAENGERVQLNKLWNRRQCTKFNGASYISQRGAEAIYTPEGKAQTRATIDYYLANAMYLKTELQKMGYTVYGGDNAPYLWVKTPNGMKSWDFFDLLLNKAHLVGTPGVGFGPSGEGYIRFTAFGEKENYIEAVSRLQQIEL